MKLKTLALLAFFVGFAANAHAFQDKVPLVTIRFNQQQILYQDQLYKAVVEAVKVKPSVIFRVSGVAPSASDPEQNSTYYNNTLFYAQKIAQDLQAMGVNPAQISLTPVSSGNVETEEVYIYVE